MINLKKLAAVVVIASAPVSISSAASAGGIFGDGGLIGGDVGKFFDEVIEGPITTPLARQATEVGAAALGEYIGGPAGAVIGRRVGQEINNVARGRPAFQQPAPVQQRRIRQQPVSQPQGGWGQPAPRMAMGNFCYTHSGIHGPGPLNPVGAPCHIFGPYGVEYGRVIAR